MCIMRAAGSEAGWCSWLQQAEVAGTGDGLGAPLDIQLAENHAVVPLDRAQGEVEPLANLVIREPLGDEAQDFQLA